MNPLNNDDDDDIPELRAPPMPTADAVFAAQVRSRLPRRGHRSLWVIAMASVAAVAITAVVYRGGQEDDDDWQIDVASSGDVFAFAELDGSSDEELSAVEQQLDDALQSYNKKKNRSGT